LLILCLYISYYHTDRILYFLDPSIEEYISGTNLELEIEHDKIVGSLSENLNIENILIQDSLYSISLKSVKASLGKSYTFKKFLVNTFSFISQKPVPLNLASLSSEIFKYTDKTNSDNLHIQNLTILDSTITSDSLSLNFMDFSISLKDILNTDKDDSYLKLDTNTVLLFLDFTDNLKAKEIFIGNKNLDANFFEGRDLNFNYEYHLDPEENIIYISSINNNINSNNLKYHFSFNARLFLSNSKVDSIQVDEFLLLNSDNKEVFTATAEFRIEDFALNAILKTKNINYYDILRPKRGKFIINGKDYKYNVYFTLHNVKDMVKETLDKLSGDFILSFNEKEPFVSFPKPVNIIDKVYNGTAKIKKMMNFGDIFYPEIEIITKSVNPFKLNKLNRVE
tara:strand:+ start:263 stop:1447 length:1185 start_codon:yes stop_codon:yes gene_type:complete